MKQSEKKDRMPLFRINFNILKKKYGFETNEEFAGFLGMSRQTVGFYLNGDRIPDALILAHIANKCDVSADWLLGLAEVPTRDEKVKFVCEYTGLSENIVQILNSAHGPWGFSDREVVLLIRIMNSLLNKDTRAELKEAIRRYIYCNIRWENRPEEWKNDLSDKSLEEEISENYNEVTWERYVKDYSVPISVHDALMFYRNKAVEIVKECTEKVFDDEAKRSAEQPIRNFRMYDTPRDENYVAPTVTIWDDEEDTDNGERKED